ncbi:RNA polymerase sigma factor [Robertkochia solimangrovi]|uniref:RNA polymerase sigma factor n=1 Tax=Robertkochia solimangrovi TaxID=2213046 RepID=UPI00117F4C86|nr:RNA polymerase sigma factor [Robertkochia solimangrovi]TRZ43685.1 RNA polymerase subunit sigma-70 [Robertkochia solimangrovi]
MEAQELVNELQDKRTQEAAFRKLVQLYKERLYWHIRRIVLDHHDTDDVLQNTFIKVYTNINGFRGESSIYSWMYRIATNEAISFLNAQARKNNITNEELKSQKIKNLRADVYFEGDEIQYKLQEALAQLPEKQLLVFNMRYYDEMKYEDISRILHTSVGALKASYHHAAKKIEEYLKNTD